MVKSLENKYPLPPNPEAFNIIGIIPARMASSRFPGKPLAKILGLPMIGHVCKRSIMSSSLNNLYIATCDHEIKDAVESFGGKAVMTANTHERASSRTAEAMLLIEKETGERIDVVVMIQGDEPLIFPEMIDEAIRPIIEDSYIQVVNLMAPLKTSEEHKDPNEVKVVVDQENFALYFSREPIPWRKKSAMDVPMYKQICVIPFTRDFLIKFIQLRPTPLEIIESIDMLRFLEHGYKVKMVQTEYETYSVDTEDDLRKVEKIMKNDPLFPKYKD